MNKKNLVLVLVVFVALVSGLFLGNMLSRRANGAGISSLLSRTGHNKVDELLSIINAEYVDTTSSAFHCSVY